jgi:hypothetical protein
VLKRIVLSVVLSLILMIPGRAAHAQEIGEWLIEILHGFQGHWCTKKLGNYSMEVTSEVWHLGPCANQEADMLITYTVIRQWDGRNGNVCWPTGSVIGPADIVTDDPTEKSSTDKAQTEKSFTNDMTFFKLHCVLTNGPPGKRYEKYVGWHAEIKDGLLYVHWLQFSGPGGSELCDDLQSLPCGGPI